VEPESRANHGEDRGFVKRRVVVDANRMFSELISLRGRFLRPSTMDEVELSCPKYVMVELFKHKERIAAASGLEPDRRGAGTAPPRLRPLFGRDALDGRRDAYPTRGRLHRLCTAPAPRRIFR
jgi:hypothetical protein